ncbi:MAG: metal ABC transporter permease [Candidatus Kapabacteria bacterium]|nr:metal ABC transporter permease [Ignavibacteriota bacterium]MCW5885416.1 metal ABC transporter permease [Candidatus Kapabacteria bacterium]
MIEFNIILISSLTAVACAIAGVFLILRRMSLMSDAISHAVLPGIIIVFILIQDRTSPLLILGAALSGLVLVYLTELVYKTKLVKEDAAIGLVFPAMFSIGVILISLNLSSVHFHEHSVLVGDINLSAINRFEFMGFLIPKSVPVLSGLLILNILFIVVFFKELKLTTFDAGLAAAFGFSPVLMHYLFMSLVSITAVGAFDTAGSILVIALMIAPAASAYLLTDSLKLMFVIAGLIGVISSVSGFYFSYWLNSTPSGGIAVITGVIFLLSYLFSPKYGIVLKALKRSKQKEEFYRKVLLIHLVNHENTDIFESENEISDIYNHVKWEKDFADKIVKTCLEQDLILNKNGLLHVTESGRKFLNGV